MALYGLHDEYWMGSYNKKYRHATEPKKVLEWVHRHSRPRSNVYIAMMYRMNIFNQTQEQVLI